MQLVVTTLQLSSSSVSASEVTCEAFSCWTEGRRGVWSGGKRVLYVDFDSGGRVIGDFCVIGIAVTVPYQFRRFR